MIRDHVNHQYPKDRYSFALDEKYYLFTRILHGWFSECALRLFHHITVSPNNRDTCWAYVRNQRDWTGAKHDHTESATINAVYYVSVPDPGSGQLRFFTPDGNKILYEHWPRPNEMLIFPGSFIHEPQITLSGDQYRVSVNMEILCQENEIEIWDRI